MVGSTGENSTSENILKFLLFLSIAAVNKVEAVASEPLQIGSPELRTADVHP